jgi:hypothetical protein
MHRATRWVLRPFSARKRCPARNPPTPLHPGRHLTPYTRAAHPARLSYPRDMNDGATILLAEDREKAFQRGRIPNPLFVVRDGKEAINYLSGTFPFSDRDHFRPATSCDIHGRFASFESLNLSCDRESHFC